MFKIKEFIELTGAEEQPQLNLMLNLLVDSLTSVQCEIKALKESYLDSQHSKDIVHKLKGIAAQAGLDKLLSLCAATSTLKDFEKLDCYISQIELDIQQYF